MDLEDRRGVLRTAPEGTGSLRRCSPTVALAPYVTWYWSVEWDLRGRPPHRQATLPHPSAQLVVENGEASLYGPPRRRFERELAGTGRVVGVRFAAGGLTALLGRLPADGRVPVDELGLDGTALAAAVTAAADLDEAAAVLDRALAAVLPPAVDPALPLVERAIRAIEDDTTLVRVDDLARRLGLGVRALQRLFARYVGLSPGAVIRRRRLQAVALRATGGDPVDWAALAVELGYVDQAHLVRDFTAAVGESPARYHAYQ